MCVIRIRSFEKGGAFIEKGLLVGARYGFYFVPLHPNSYNLLFFIEHLKR